jgi:hypothetical protein
MPVWEQTATCSGPLTAVPVVQMATFSPSGWQRLRTPQPGHASHPLCTDCARDRLELVVSLVEHMYERL